MNHFGLNFHHFGLATQDEGAAILYYEQLGYTIGNKIYDPEQNVYLRLCTFDNQPTVEIVTQGKDQGDSPLKPILKRAGEMIYHTCYYTDNLNFALSKIEECGLRVLELSPPKKAILFNGKFVSFYHLPGVGVIEILEL